MIGERNLNKLQSVVGRKRDAALEAKILTSTLDLLVEHGAAGLTMDLVAQRAGAGKASIYRRWNSKRDLILDAVALMKRMQVGAEQLPDTGSVRGDLLAMFRPQSAGETQRRMKIMAELGRILADENSQDQNSYKVVVQPWADAHLSIMRRGEFRGEVTPGRDLEVIATILPSMAAFRVMFLREPIDLEFISSMVDNLILPALGLKPPSPTGNN